MTTPVNETEYRELSDFLFYEAELLSEQDYVGWEKLLAEDLRYHVPVPQYEDPVGGRKVGISNGYFDEDIQSMRVRLKLLSSPQTTTSEYVRSLLNHVVTNVRVSRVNDTEYECRSCITVHRTRFSMPEPTTLSGRRRDLIRRTDDGLKLVSREVKLVHSTLLTSNISYFF